MMQTEYTTVPFLPCEIITQILSELTIDLEHLKKPWSRVCRLFRKVMEDYLVKYCEKYGLKYSKLKRSHFVLFSLYPESVLPIVDFVECAVTRKIHQELGSYEPLSPRLPDPSIDNRVGYFKHVVGDMLPTKAMLRMAMMVGNKALCNHLLNYPALRADAIEIITYVFNKKRVYVAMHRNQPLHFLVLPWEILAQALARALLFCYEKLAPTHAQLPERSFVLKNLLARKEFIWLEIFIKQWPIALLVPRTVDLLLTDLCNVVSLESWERLGELLVSQYHARNQEKLFKRVRECRHQVEHCQLTQFYLKKIIPEGESYVNSCEYTLQASHNYYIGRYHIFNPAFDYLNYLTLEIITAVDYCKVLLEVVRVFDQCPQQVQFILIPRIETLLNQNQVHLNKPDFTKELWHAALQGNCTFVLANLCHNQGFERDPVQDKLQITHDASTMFEHLNRRLNDPISSDLLLYLLRHDRLSKTFDWELRVKNVLLSNDFRSETGIELIKYFVSTFEINQHDNLLNALKKYTECLIKSAYKDLDCQIVVQLKDLITLQWNLLEALYTKPCHLSLTKAEKHQWLMESFELVSKHSDPSVANHLAPMRLCHALRLSLVDLANDFFRYKKYPSLLASLGNKANASAVLEQLLLPLDKKWWHSTLFRRPELVRRKTLQATASLLIEYPIKDLELIQYCLQALVKAHQWCLIHKLASQKSEIMEYSFIDQCFILSCIDADGYFVGGIGDQSVLNWMSELLEQSTNKTSTVKLL